MDPSPFLYMWIQSTAIIYFLHFLQVTILFHTIQITLCFQQAGEIDTLTVTLGQSFLVVLCRWCLKSYWFDNLGLFSEGKLAATLIIPSSWCLPTDVWSARINHFFWRHCQGLWGTCDKRLQLLQQHFFWHHWQTLLLAPYPPSCCKGNLTLPTFLLCYCLA